MMSIDRLSSGSPAPIWREMVRLQDEMNRLLTGFATPQAGRFPAFNIWTGDESMVLTAELPGVILDDLEITVHGNTLTIEGSRTQPETEQGATYHRRERWSGKFTRSLTLPYRVEQDQVSATLVNGLLTVTLPRAFADRPRKIEIKNTL